MNHPDQDRAKWISWLHRGGDSVLLDGSKGLRIYHLSRSLRGAENFKLSVALGSVYLQHVNSRIKL